MSKHLGDFDASTVIYGKFTTYRPSSGAPFTLAGTPALSVYKDNSTTQSTSGVTLTVDFDAVTGLHHFAIDTSADGTFYSAGSNFDVVITAGTVDGVSVVGSAIASFSIRKDSALKATTAGRTLDVTATGEAGIDLANIGAPAAGPVPSLGIVDGGTAQAATSTTLQLRSAAAFASSELVGAVVVITGGSAGVGQSRQITAYNGATDTATVDAWTTTPTGTITYVIFASPPASATPPEVNVTQFNGVACTSSGGRPEVNTTHVAGTSQTAGDIIADTNDLQTTVAAVAGYVDTEVAAIKARTDLLPAVAAGASGGLMINGANTGAVSFDSGVSISNSGGSALTLTSTGGDGDGLRASGNGSGDGIAATGGATGRGVHALGGATSGAGIRAEGQGGNANGLNLFGNGSGHGLAATGGATGHGMHLLGGASGGDGLRSEAQAGNGNGVNAIGQGTGLDLAADNLATAAQGTAIQAVTDKLDDMLVLSSDGWIFTIAALQDAPSGGGSLTAADIADAVWDEALAGHAIAGSAGAALSAAGSAGDPWSTLLPGAYGAGTAGSIIGNNLNATVSSRASQTSVDDLPTNAELATALGTSDDAVLAVLGTPAGASLAADVAAIQADTNDLQTRVPAALVGGRMDASVGAMAANVLTASAVAADAVTELQSGLATSAALAGVEAKVDTVDGVVDAILVDTSEIGLAGAGLTALASAANLATVAGYLDTEIAAIKAKTDALPASPAATGDIPSAAAIADAVHDEVVEGSVTLRQSIRLHNAVLGGKASGLATTEVTYRDLGDTVDRVVATVDADGNRSAVTRTLT